MKVIVDTNIVFSALVNTESRIADLLLNSGNTFEFYSCYLLQEELTHNQDRLLVHSGMTEEQLAIAQFQIFSAIEFISEDLLPFSIWQTAIPLVREVDMDDVAFVALTEYLEGNLWTGDKKLIQGLMAKGFLKLVTTGELQEVRSNADQK